MAKALSRDRRVILYVFYMLILLPDFVKTMGHGANIVSVVIRGIAGIIAAILMACCKKSRILVNLTACMGYILIVTVLKTFNVSNIVRYVATYADIFTMAVFTDYLLTNDASKQLPYFYCQTELLVFRQKKVFLPVRL